MMLVSVRRFNVLWINLGLLLIAKMACAQLYSADLTNSEWKVVANPFACSLSHNVPVFGKAVFSRKAGSSETFYMESSGKVNFPAGIAVMETLPPPWRNDLTPVPLGAFKAIGGDQPIILNATEVAPMVTQLKLGVNVMTSSQAVASASSGASAIRVVLNAKNFSAGYTIYQKCIADIIPYSFAQVARTTIHYAEKAEGLTAANKAELDRVVRYTKADSKVIGILVDGHSDNSGTSEENEATSKQAAEWVVAYLTGKGIAADKITTRWHGDNFVIGNNKNAAGKAKNRRVTVRLEDEASRKDVIKKAEEKRQSDEKAAAEKAIADATKAVADTNSAEANASATASSSSKMTPEEISRMVEGYDPVNVR
jgi:outer membrane protein OmpA-like peptidoglycan-associated protein